MALENYVYEFVFTDNYSDDIFNIYPDKTDGLRDVIQDSASKLANIIRVQQGIRQIGSFPEYNGVKYKVTVINSKWIQPVLVK